MPPSLPCHSHPTKALGSFHSCQPSSVNTLSRPPLGEDDRVVVLVSGRLVEPAAPVSGLHWEATPPDSRARLPASRGREEGQPPTGVPTPTHQPTKLPTPTHHYPTQHHLTTISSITIRFNSIPPPNNKSCHFLFTTKQRKHHPVSDQREAYSHQLRILVQSNI